MWKMGSGCSHTCGGTMSSAATAALCTLSIFGSSLCGVGNEWNTARVAMVEQRAEPGGPSSSQRMKTSFYHEPQKLGCPPYGKFHPDGISTAHRTLRCGTRLTVCYRQKCVYNVLVNDRGPAAWTGRQLDVSRGVARRLGFMKAGEITATVTVEPTDRWIIDQLL